jgi:hypothetical protein
VYAGRGKRSVLSRVPTHFRPESPPSSRKTFYFQYGGCPGHAQICLLTANSGSGQAAINRFLTEANDDPKPFVWTADPDRILEKVSRGHQALDAIH